MPAMKGHYGQYDSSSYVAASDAKLGHGSKANSGKKSSGNKTRNKSSKGKMSY